MRRGRGPGLAILLTAVVSMLAAALCLSVLADDRSITFAFGLIAALLVVVVTVSQPFVGLLAYLAVTLLRPGDRFPALENLRLVLLLAGLTFSVWVAQYLIRRKPAPLRHPVLRDEICLALAALWSMVPVSLRLGLDSLVNGLLKTMAMSIVAANLTRTPRRLRMVCWVVVASAAVNAVLAWQELVSGAQTDFVDRAAGVGVLADPNDLALTLVTFLPLAVALLWAERGFYKRFALVLIIGALIGGVVVSQSRGGALGLMVVLFLEGYDRLRNRGARAFYAAAGVTVGLVGVTALLMVRGQSWGTLSDDPNVYNRKGAWVGGYRMLMDNPFTGVGIYMFPDRLDEYGPTYLEQRNIVAHNSFVQVGAELGLPGLVFFLLMLSHGWTAANRARRLAEERACGRSLYQLGGAMRRMIAGWVVCAFFLAQAYQVWLYLLLGIVVATEHVLSEQPMEEATAA